MNKAQLFLLVAGFMLHTSLFAQTGWLDTDLNGTGKATTDLAGFDDIANSVVLQPDGNLVLGGYTYNGVYNSPVVARFLPDGTPDNSFGSGGIYVAELNAEADCVSVLLQPDGKIVLAGNYYNGADHDFLVMRFTNHGQPDTGFGDNGKVLLSVGSDSDIATAAVLQPDGKIVVAGDVYDGVTTRIGVARLNTDGSLDTTFNADGKLITSFGANASSAAAIVLQSDGKMVLAGVYKQDDLKVFGLARLYPDGAPDNGFGTNGQVNMALGAYNAAANAVCIQSDGKILAAGSFLNVNATDFAVARFNSNGTPDISFGNNGIKITAVNSSEVDLANCIAVQPDGKIVAAGYATDSMNGSLDFTLIRYLPNGNPDGSFGLNGILKTDFFGKDDQALGMLFQPDGKTVLAGLAFSVGGKADLALARYLPELSVGSSEFSFAPNNLLIYPNPVAGRTILKLNLPVQDNISISMFDGNGNCAAIFQAEKTMEPGEHRVVVELPNKLPAGVYTLRISGRKGQIGIQIVHEEP